MQDRLIRHPDCFLAGYFAAEGVKGGMVAYYAMKYIGGAELGRDRKTMVLLVGDGGESYLSHAFNETWMIENELLEPNVEKELAAFYG